MTLVHQAEKAIIADRCKDEFLAMLAHELRNPLAPISNAMHILRAMSPPYANLEPVRVLIERNVNHMVRLVDDLLDMSRITTGKIELRKERLNLASVVRNAIETSGPSIEARRHELTVATPEQPLDVEGDAVRLTQVVTNLLNNAAKYTPEGGHIWVSVKRQRGEAIVSVRDNGPGIPADMLDKVFDLFTQIRDGEHRSRDGLGIGLALVKRLVAMHGGQVEARRVPGGGAEFIVRLPLAADSAQREGMDDETPHEGEKASYRILVVDDSADAADSLAMLLAADAHEVCTAYDGRTAIEKATACKPDVMLLDLGMPGMDGIETARKIRALPGGSDIVIVALTGWGQEKDRNRTKEAGFDFHLVKPLQSSELHRVLNAVSDKAKRPEARVAPAAASLQTIPNDHLKDVEKEQEPISKEFATRFSHIAHDLAECFFGIRMAAECLDLDKELTHQKTTRIVDSIYRDCARGRELVAAVRENLADQSK